MAPSHREPLSPRHCAVWIGHQGTPACVTLWACHTGGHRQRCDEGVCAFTRTRGSRRKLDLSPGWHGLEAKW